MAITPKLSRKLYETLGDEAAAEMTDWMQKVDASRAELRELNELNYSRIEARFAQIDVRFAQVDARFAQVDARFEQIDARFTQLETTIVARLEAKIEQRTADLMKWSFVFWVGAVGAVALLAGVLG